jgi:4a-hydroxytetrahydrobiopterin dehydratase
MNWEIKNKKLTTEIYFKSVSELASFISQIAELIDKENHHPDFFISHTHLKIELFTYDRNQITEKDQSMSLQLSKCYENYLNSLKQ